MKVRFFQGDTLHSICRTFRFMYMPEWSMLKPWQTYENGTALGINFGSPEEASRWLKLNRPNVHLNMIGVPYSFRFNPKKLRATLYAWHGGQNSVLYAAASSGLVESVVELQEELIKCSRSLQNDKANYRDYKLKNGTVYQSSMKAKPYEELNYLQEVARHLPIILGPEIIVSGRTYRTFSWHRTST